MSLVLGRGSGLFRLSVVWCGPVILSVSVPADDGRDDVRHVSSAQFSSRWYIYIYMCVCVCALGKAHMRPRRGKARQFSSVQFEMVYIYMCVCVCALGKAHMRSTPTQFSSRWYICARERPYALQPDFQKFSPKLPKHVCKASSL